MDVELPVGWRIEVLRNLVEQSDVRRGAAMPEPTVLSCSKDLGLVRQATLFGRRLASADTRRYKLVLPGDFVYDPNLLWTGSIARNALGITGIVSPVYEVFRAIDDCDPEYLRHWLKRPARIKEFAAISEGTNVRRRRASFDDFAGLRIKLPEPNEQRRIAGVLDAIDEAIEKTEAVIAATEAVRKALLQELLTRGVPGWHTEWKTVPGIGEIPACWEVVRLGEVAAEPIRNGFSAGTQDDETGWWLLTLGAVSHRGFVPGGAKPTRPDVRVRSFLLKPGDLLVSRSNTSDRVGLAGTYTGTPGNCSYPDLLMRVRVDLDRTLAEFVEAQLLSARGRKYFQLHARGTSSSMVKITGDILRAFPVAVPCLQEQQKILDAVGVFNAQLGNLGQGQIALEHLKATAADALLSGRVRVPLGREAAG